ncbi:MAG: hypothetical protein PHX08_24670 [Lachnospiraceae bacterium]|nr:hypothetical protein [Lachnospiraceae bacterium]
MLTENRKLYGIFSCVVIGIVILFTSLFYSKVDKNVISGSELTNFGERWQVSAGDEIYCDVSFPTHIDNVKFGDTMVLEKLLPSDMQLLT